MAIGDRIRIVTEKEYRIMSPPRRPRGEKPQTTIRYLHRQISNMAQELLGCRKTLHERSMEVARHDVELSEAADRERILMQQIEDGADAHGGLLAAYQKNTIRLSFLEGYYEKSTELLPHDPAQTHRGSGAGNQENLPDGAPRSEEEGIEAAPGRTGGGPRGEIRGFRPGDPAYTDRRPMAEPEIGIPHDATRSELARHRR